MARTSAPAALALTHLISTSAIWTSRSSSIEIGSGSPSDGPTRRCACARARDDLDGWAERLRAANVPLFVESRETCAVYVFRIADPDGYEIEIYAELG